MNEDFTTLALRYLLDELESGERAEFESRLEREPATAAAFKTCADSLGRFGLERGFADSLPAEEQQVLWTELQLQMAEAGLPSVIAPAGRARWRKFVWPFAAALLLALNLWQWSRSRPAESHAAVGTAETAGPTSAGEISRKTAQGEGSVVAASGNHPGTIPLQVTDPRVAAELRRLEELRREYQALQKDRDALAKEYGKIVNQLVPGNTADTGAGRLVAMELVDEASYDNGDRNGLLMKAKALLTTPGLVAVPSPSASGTTSTGSGASTAPSSPSNESASVPSGATTTSTTPTSVSTVTGTVASVGSTEAIGTTATTSIISSTSSSTGTPSETSSDAGSAAPSAASSASGSPSASAPSSAPSAESSTSPSPTAPYAWSVYDDTAHQGYLNLYNLPEVGAGSVMELWVMPSGSDQFQAVGQVPSQFYGQSGSVYYQLPAATATPSQVLITVESGTGPAPTAPSGTVVLRGP